MLAMAPKEYVVSPLVSDSVLTTQDTGGAQHYLQKCRSVSVHVYVCGQSGGLGGVRAGMLSPLVRL